MIAFFAFVIGVCIGIVIGAALVKPYLDGPPRQRKPKPAKPPTIPLARAIHGVTWQRLEVPTMKRRQQIPTVKGPQ